MSGYLTPKGFKKLKKELDYLKKVKRKEIAERLKKTASMGDLSENAAYHEAKEAQGFLEGRILELGETIRGAKVVEKIERAGWVQIGSTVLLSSNNDKPTVHPVRDSKGKAHKEQISNGVHTQEKFKIVGTAEADPLNGKISADSPLGKALLDKPEGATVTVETPNGKIKYKIIKIE